MKMMKSKLVAAVVMAAAMVGANADTVSYSDSVALTPTNWTDTLMLSQFNMPGATLNKVTITLDGLVQSTFILGDNGNTGAQEVEANARANISVNNALIGATGVTVTPGGTGSTTLADDATDVVFGPVSGQGSNSVVLTSDLGGFVGAGSIVLDAAGRARSFAVGDGNFTSSITTDAAASVTIVYDYTAAPAQVPEPASLALVGLALAGVAAARRRKA